MEQSVYVPVRSQSEIGRNAPDDRAYHVEFGFDLRKYHRIFFRNKISRVKKSIIQSGLSEQIDLIHSHFLFSDGAVALALKKQLGTSYLTAVRNTDINVFFKFRPDLKPLAYEILNEASAVICLNNAYANRLLDLVPEKKCPGLKQRLYVIPNGLEQSWLDNRFPRANAPETIRCIYVGDLSKNKNIESTVAALSALRRRYSVELSVVGSGGNGQSRFFELQKKYDFIHYFGRVESRTELRGLMRKADIFVMPSFKETFGLVYLEALSQGLPIVYSRGEGVDGYFDHHLVGEKVSPYAVQEIEEAIEKIFCNLASYRKGCLRAASSFSWDKIAIRYLELYQTLLAIPAPAEDLQPF